MGSRLLVMTAANRPLFVIGIKADFSFQLAQSIDLGDWHMRMSHAGQSIYRVIERDAKPDKSTG